MGKLSLAMILLAAILFMGRGGVSDAKKKKSPSVKRKLSLLEANLATLQGMLQALKEKQDQDMANVTQLYRSVQQSLEEQGAITDCTQQALKNQGITTTCESEGSAWLNTTCASQSECTAGGENTTCYEGRCNCLPGYYYTVSADSCVSSCAKSDLGTGFTYYYKGNIISSILTSKFGLDEEECFKFCESVDNCRTIDYRPGDKACYPMDNTALQTSWSPVATPYHHHYQRYCA